MFCADANVHKTFLVLNLTNLNNLYQAAFRHITKSSSPYGQVIVLPSRRLVRPAADDDFVIYRNAPYGEVLVLPS